MLNVSEVMTKNVEMVHETTRLDLVAQRMKEHNVGFLVVGNGVKATGCITDRDLVISAMAKGLNPKQHVVSEVMTRHLLTCGEHTKLTKVIELMRDHKIYRVVVTDVQGRPSGIVTLGDLAARVSDQDFDMSQALRTISQHSQHAH